MSNKKINNFNLIATKHQFLSLLISELSQRQGSPMDRPPGGVQGG